MDIIITLLLLSTNITAAVIFHMWEDGNLSAHLSTENTGRLLASRLTPYLSLTWSCNGRKWWCFQEQCSIIVVMFFAGWFFKNFLLILNVLLEVYYQKFSLLLERGKLTFLLPRIRWPHLVAKIFSTLYFYQASEPTTAVEFPNKILTLVNLVFP